MAYPPSSYIEITTLPAPAVAGGARATAAQSTMPARYQITIPSTALYDTVANPLMISPITNAMLIFVLNLEAVSVRVRTGTANDFGVVVPPKSQVELAVVNGMMTVLASTAGTVNAPFTARAVVTAALPVYTRAGATITANAVGAPGAVFDGVTPVAGDTVLLQEGIAVAAADAGPYVIRQMGTAGLALILDRPLWWPDGGFVPEAAKITIQEGTTFKNTKWTPWVTTATVVIGTSAPLLFVDEVMLAFTLVAGTLAVPITNVGIRSATLADVKVNRRVAAGAGIANTIGYWPTVAGANGVTPGAVGTSSIQVQAVVAAGTVNATDTSAVTVSIKNL